MFAIASRNFLRNVRFQFCNVENAKTKLKEIVERQIRHQNENLEDVASIEKFFKNEGWTIKYNNIQVQLQKQKGIYTVNVLFNARSPMPLDQQNQAKKDMEEDQQYVMPKDISSCTFIVKKAGEQKYLFGDFLNSDQGAILQNIQFTKNIQAQKFRKGIDRLMGYGVESIGYQGPQLNSLDHKVQQSLHMFIQNLGVDDKLLKQVAHYSIAYQQKFYIQWLKDLNSLV